MLSTKRKKADITVVVITKNIRMIIGSHREVAIRNKYYCFTE